MSIVVDDMGRDVKVGLAPPNASAAPNEGKRTHARPKSQSPAFETSLYGDSCVAKVAIAVGVVLVIIAALFAAGLFGKGTPDCNPQFYAVPIGVSGLVAILLGAVCYPSKQTAKTTAAAVQSLKTEEDAQMQKTLEASRREAAPTLTLPPPNAPAKTGAAAGPALEIKEEKKS